MCFDLICLYLLPGALASFRLETSVLGVLSSLWTAHPVHFLCSVCWGPAMPRLGLLDFISLPLILQLFLYSAFLEVSSTIFADITSVDSISGLNFQEISPLSSPFLQHSIDLHLSSCSFSWHSPCSSGCSALYDPSSANPQDPHRQPAPKSHPWTSTQAMEPTHTAHTK